MYVRDLKGDWFHCRHVVHGPLHIRSSRDFFGPRPYMSEVGWGRPARGHNLGSRRFCQFACACIMPTPTQHTSRFGSIHLELLNKLRCYICPGCMLTVEDGYQEVQARFRKCLKTGFSGVPVEEFQIYLEGLSIVLGKFWRWI